MDNSTKQDHRPSMQWYPDDWWAELNLKLCSMAAQGLWFNMLNIMFKSKPRGILPLIGDSKSIAKDGKTVLLYGKQIAKILSQNEDEVHGWLKELIDNQVCSIDADGCLYCRRMRREWKNGGELSSKRAEAGKLGAEKRWQKDGKRMAKMATSTPSSISSSLSLDEKESRKKDTTPTKDMFTHFEAEWRKTHGGSCVFTTVDGAQARKIWRQCLKDAPDNPMEFYDKRMRQIMKEYHLDNFRALISWWNSGAKQQKKSGWDK